MLILLNVKVHINAHALYEAKVIKGEISLQERLAAQSVVLDEREAALQECEGQRTHAEAEAAVQHHQQQGITARLENSEADMAAKVHWPIDALSLH